MATLDARLLAEPLAAERLALDPDVVHARAMLLGAVARHQRTLTGPKPADPDRAVSYSQAIAALEGVRGGSLIYPYLGSGVGRGALVELSDGSVKYDLIAGVGTHHLGHSHPVVTAAAIDAALTDTVMHGNLQSGEIGLAFAEEILDAARESGARLAHCLVTTSGAMACENALKIALQARHPAARVLAFEGCFTGRTLATAQITDRPAFRDGLPEVLAVDRVPFFDPRDPAGSIAHARERLAAHLARHPGRHAAMVFELVLGEGGFYPGSAAFHRALMEDCRAAGVLVLVDEVQTFLRLTRPFAFQHYGLDELVDVAWVGKASQACATLFTTDLAPRPGLVTQTFTASASALHTGLAIVRHLRSGGYFGVGGSIARTGARFAVLLADIAGQRPDLISGPWGTCSMVGCTPHDGDPARVRAFLADLFERGVIGLAAGSAPTRARFLLPAEGLDDHDLEVCAALVAGALEATA